VETKEETPEEVPEEPQAEETPVISPPGPSSKARARLIRIAVFAVVAAVGAWFILPKAPHEQNLRLHLGSGSSRVVRATARVGRGGAWDRETTWTFEHGAPPAIAWKFELPNGKADVEVELASSASIVGTKTNVQLGGGETNVELSETMRGLP